MSNIIDGKAIAGVVREEVAAEVAEWQQRSGRAPGLHVVLVGEDPASAVYVRNKEKAAAKAGIAGKVHRLPASSTTQQVLDLVKQLNADAAVDGILVQLPLPDGVDPKPILEEIDPAKDVDGFHAVNVGALWTGQRGLVPCTPAGCIRLLREADTPLEGARAVVVGRSNIVGKPMAALLLANNATVTIAHSRTQDLADRCREADVLVVAAGRPRMVTAEFIKPGATVIDVGMHRTSEGKLCGDVDFDSVAPVARAITPAPGGVGPMTIAMLLRNTLLAARARCG